MANILISGVSGGMGLQTAKRFVSECPFVYGLDIKEPSETLSNFKFIKTDLTNIDEVNKADIALTENEMLDRTIIANKLLSFIK